MKHRLPLLALPTVLLLGACAGTGAYSDASRDDGRVRVDFENPARFTDVKSSSIETVSEAYLEELRRHIVRRAGGYLAPGQTLAITFTDIDMAGEYEPWRINLQDVRLVKPIYPPRAHFTWVLADEDGAIVREGRERLVDMGFEVRAGFNRFPDPLYYEKQMLDDWMRRALRRR